VALYHSYLLPWTVIPEENQRLKRNVLTALVVAVVFGLAVPFFAGEKSRPVKSRGTSSPAGATGYGEAKAQAAPAAAQGREKEA
jgi:hypothetical protein